ncbi:MAG: hypothetical protein Q7K57_04630 [Burkholderiaceae bacterium]|nr:hypothetical protein [Burkholderiaceae bacterium]
MIANANVFEVLMDAVRSRTSGENLVDFLMAPFSQRLEPPQKPGRFKQINDLG